MKLVRRGLFCYSTLSTADDGAVSSIKGSLLANVGIELGLFFQQEWLGV